ncbi:MAG: MoaD/ThiS family protein [Thaumarchaeota archaeon]|nr:MoaD/ThiS family protein [Candidatus Calditenuaceae archaeon]MDW8186798.1 MoaD/ThiS family protein [Nitrososphaerota archaeon]
MPRIKVVVTAPLATHMGGLREVEVEAETVREVIGQLVERFGAELRNRLLDDSGRLRRFVNLYVNDSYVDPEEDRRLSEGDEVLILPAVSGGIA